MAGDYPSADFEMSEDGAVRRIVHVPSGMTLVTPRVSSDPVAISSAYTIEAEGEAEGAGIYHPQEIGQAALRHLRVWAMRRYGKGRRGLRP